jgi:hypothetical protein
MWPVFIHVSKYSIVTSQGEQWAKIPKIFVQHLPKDKNGLKTWLILYDFPHFPFAM